MTNKDSSEEPNYETMTITFCGEGAWADHPGEYLITLIHSRPDNPHDGSHAVFGNNREEATDLALLALTKRLVRNSPGT